MYTLKLNTKNDQHGYFCGVHACVKFGLKSAIGYRNFGKKHRGYFYGTPCTLPPLS